MNVRWLLGKAPVALTAACLHMLCEEVKGEWVWIEGENPTKNEMHRHPWWYDKVKRAEFSNHDFISNFNDDKVGGAEYSFRVSQGGQYEFWIRANPTATKLGYSLNEEPEKNIPIETRSEQLLNVAEDNAVDLRFLSWIKVGSVSLRPGMNSVRFRMLSEKHHHGMIDCFVFINEPFEPNGTLKPNAFKSRGQVAELAESDWIAFQPSEQNDNAESAVDLRFLNEEFAGQNGFISVNGEEFIHLQSGKGVRFWAVNGTPSNVKEPKDLKRLARKLAKYGINMVRVHSPIFDSNGDAAAEKIRHFWNVVEAMKSEGIYVHFSIYFPLWIKPKPNTSWLEGYDGDQHPFAALFFNKDFQSKYRGWWTELLNARSSETGRTLIEEPAVAGVEILNEDSFFFWTFNTKNLPEAQMRLLELQFGEWLKGRHGSIEKAVARWNGVKSDRDNFHEGRVGFRPLWNMFSEKTIRDQETARFLFETQRKFYSETYRFLRDSGFKGLITASNWATASPEVFGPLEKWSYLEGDFIDRHGYFSCNHKGEFSEWSIRDGHTYADRSALRFDSSEPGKGKLFVHPAMDPVYQNKPSMISETTWNRPNRYRSEAPLYFATYGALQGTDAIVHFALDGAEWNVKPGFFMQPWTLTSPAMLGQFPAAALIYRLGLVSEGATLAEVDLGQNDLLSLSGTPLPQDAALDELRLKEVPAEGPVHAGELIDPLIHFAGKVMIRMTNAPSRSVLRSLKGLVDRNRQTITSSTRELKLGYDNGTLAINAPSAQGVSGALRTMGRTELGDIAVNSEMELGHIVVVSLDRKPIAQSSKMLLQVMSEEKASGFETEPAGAGSFKIKNIGTNPWLIRKLSGTVEFFRSAGQELKVEPLDMNGIPQGKPSVGPRIRLQPDVIYYLITR